MHNSAKKCGIQQELQSIIVCLVDGQPFVYSLIGNERKKVANDCGKRASDLLHTSNITHVCICENVIDKKRRHTESSRGAQSEKCDTMHSANLLLQWQWHERSENVISVSADLSLKLVTYMWCTFFVQNNKNNWPSYGGRGKRAT